MTTISKEDSDFKNWFELPLLSLYGDSHSGFAVMLIAVPLLERLIRIKSGAKDFELNASHLAVLSAIFPALKGQEVNFWKTCRNGLVHQGTFTSANRNGSPNPNAAIAGTGYPVTMTQGAIVVDPVAFSKTTIEAIRNHGVERFMTELDPHHVQPVVFNLPTPINGGQVNTATGVRFGTGGAHP